MKDKPGPSSVRLLLFAATIASLLLWIGKLAIPSMLFLYVYFKLGLMVDPSQLRLAICLGLGGYCSHLFQRYRWPLPHPALLATLLLGTFGMHGYVLYRKAHRVQDIQAKIRTGLAESLQPYNEQTRLDWGQIPADCGATIDPQGLTVVTRYGIHCLPWQTLRQAQVFYERPQFAMELNKRWLSPEIPPEPAMKGAFWQTTLEKIVALKLMQPLPKSDRLVLVRKIDDPVPTPTRSFAFPAPGPLKYLGLPVATLGKLNCPNGVTLCPEGIIIRDVCGVQSAAWSEVQTLGQGFAAGGLLEFQITCAQGSLDPFGGSEYLTLQPDDREALQKELIRILGLQAQERNGQPPLYLRTGAALKPPTSNMYYAGCLTRRR